MVSPDGRFVYMTGESGISFLTVAVDAATGQSVWSALYNTSGSDFSYRLALTPDGARLVVTGQSSAARTVLDVITVCYDAITGAELWAARHDGPTHGYDAGTDVTTSPDGQQAYVTGVTGGGRTHDDLVAIAYDIFTGAERWVDKHDGSGTLSDWGASMASSLDGSTLFVSGAEGNTTEDFLILA
ncbi:MAG TPA: PQQ-binding-like beta-propeller repeat protein, partial [Gemmatimonadales bacterium]|nr:PQQ-binding-like beta-propeller repeat protein [Gemmatimonadales bacterium]